MRAVLPLLLLFPSVAYAQCRLCPQSPSAMAERPERPLHIEVETALDLGRAAGNGRGGSISLDERSGARQVSGLTDLGGFAIKGSVRLTGEPFRHVRISLPPNARLTAPNGSIADAVDMRADIGPDPMLDASGTLVFGFGGRLIVTGDASGEFRGRITISADYL